MSTTNQSRQEWRPTRLEDGIPFGAKLHELAEQRRDDTAVTVVALDGTAQLADVRRTRRPRQPVGARAGRQWCPNGFPMSHWQSRIHSTWCWPRWGAGRSARSPFPMHWDLPEWERDRVRAVIDPAVVVDEQSRWELDARAAGESASPLPTAVSPTANGICSSGSTGVPKVILNLAPSLWTPQHGEPFLSTGHR